MKQLAGFCSRVGLSYNAGLSLAEAVKREASRQRSRKLPASVLYGVAAAMENGNSFAASLRLHKGYFGEMFIALIEVGETSGHLGEMLNELADYYERMLQFRCNFIRSITWPLIEFVSAIVIVGVLILLLGVIQGMTGQRIDILGFGLVGGTGFIIYLLFWAVLAVFGYIFHTGMKQNVQTSRFVHYALVKIPKVGVYFLKIALMKLSWGLNLTTGTGMDIRRALALSFQGSGFFPVSDQLPAVLAALERGEGLAGAFDAADYLDREFLVAVETGEQSGNLPELMGRLSKRYDQESQLLLNVLSVVGGFVVYGGIALCIILVIFRIFSFYLGILTDATKM